MIDVEIWKKKKKSLKITFEDLSEISGIPKRTLEDIFAGRTSDPRHDTVQAIEKALGISQASPLSYSISAKEQRMLCAFSKLAPAMQDHMIAIVEKLIGDS